jgi:serine/threonine protein kinase
VGEKTRPERPPLAPPSLALGATSPEASSEDLGRLGPGARIRQYELIRELGRGGMGIIYLARDTKLGRRVAMKFLMSDKPGFTERILAEARATARCNHENIVVIHEADEHHGRPYMVLEYLEGQTLAATLDGRKPTVGQAIEWIVPVVRALVRAHEFDIVHRDLKPSNIFLTSGGSIKVLDFGIARVFSPAAERADAMAPNVESLRESFPAGTIAYMAPEQVMLDVDHRTDLWAVGVILFEMIAGRHPFAGLGPDDLLDRVMELDKPMPPIGDVVPNLPVELERVLDRCLAKQKSKRFASARELVEALDPLLPRRLGKPLAEDANPYPGLAAFEEGDADRFFGRTQDTARLLARMRSQPITAVVGPSGVGKSSFVRAGVIPALKASADSWEVLVLRPGRHPLVSLATLLARLTTRRSVAHEAIVERLGAEPGYLGALLRERANERSARILLFVDQFEELYALVPDAHERLAFTACLSGVADDAAAPLRVLLSIRSDFVDRAAEDRRFVEELTRGLLFLPPLGRDGLREALVQPLEQAGYRFESAEMVGQMLDTLETAAGALPLLQFAASKLWDTRDRRRRIITRESYGSIGGVTGALAAHADEVIRALSPSAQRLARTLLVRLVTPEGTRAVVDADELLQLPSEPGEVGRLLDHLSTARLLVVQTRSEIEGPTVELVHESLIAGWPTLRRWLEEGREDAAFLAELRAAARQWAAKGRRSDLLWRGEAMEEARLWRGRFKGDLAQRESEFLDATFALANRAARIRRWLLGGTIGLLLAIVAAGTVALVSIRRAKLDAVAQAERAQREAERARAAEQKVKDDLAVIEGEQRAKEKARSEVVQGKEQLRQVNGDLERALTKAQAESKHAQEAATTAQTLADSLKRANDQLQKLLAEERARRERLEQERKKITTELK